MTTIASRLPAENIRPMPLTDLNLPPAKIGSGERVMSAWGRHLAPAPTINCTTDRSSNGSLRRLDDWLIREAIAEAGLRKDAFAAKQFERMTPATVTLSDRDLLNLYLFHNIDGVHEASFVAPALAAGATR